MNILRRHCHFSDSRNTFVNGTFYSSSNSTIQHFPTEYKSKLFYLRPFALVQRDILHVGHSDEFHWSVVKYFKTAPRSLDERMARPYTNGSFEFSEGSENSCSSRDS